jgi:protocatechuate 3,4-dioxygenase beta subunit
MAGQMASRRLTACCLALAAIGLAGALVRSQAPGPEIPAGPNVLLGRVADARTDQPVAGAVVTLTGYFDPSGKPLAPAETGRAQGVSAPRSVITNADGYFFFRNLPAAKYSIVADAFGYISNSYPLKIVELNNGDRPAPVQLYVTKFSAISGTVLDEHGEPLAGVPVFAMRRVMLGGSIVLSTARPGATTDDRGIYRIARLPPGNYIVGVVSESLTLPAAVAASIEAAARYPGAPLEGLIPNGLLVATGDGIRIGDSVLQRTSGPAPPPPSADGRMLAYATKFGPGTMLPSEATVITLQSGDQRTGADIALRLSPAVRVSGVATSPNGPMKNLAIRLLPPGASDTADMDPKGAVTAVTDANGVFTFPAVTPGPYVLRAAYADPANPNIPNSADVSLWASQPLAVLDTDVSGLAVTMKAGLRVSGRIEFKGAGESPIDDSGRWSMGLRPVGAQSWRSLRGIPAADGSFATPGDPPGRYVVFAVAPGWTLQTVTRGGKVVMDDVIELDSGDLSGLVLTMSRESNRIAGSITDAAGANAADADVTVFPADSTLWREGIINSRRVRSVHATSSAAFVISDLAPGDYYVAAVGSRFVIDAADPLFLARLIPGATKLTLGEGETKTTQLKTFIPRDK